MPFGFNRIFNSLVKELDKQFKELDKEIEKDQGANKKVKRNGISINISSFGDNPPEIKIKSFGDVPMINENIQNRLVKPVQQIQTQKISDDDAKRLSFLPREEANATVRRLSNKLIYEIDVPGVKSIKDIFINELENSIEIKAIGKDRAYLKLIPLKFPIKKYSLKDDKLVLELDSR